MSINRHHLDSPSSAATPAAPRIRPVRHPFRWVEIIVVLTIAVLFARSVVTNPRFEWNVVAEYFTAPIILHGLRTTILLTVICMVGGSALGTILAVLRMSSNVVVSGLTWGYIWFFRGTPVLVQLIILFNLSALYPRISLGIPFGGPIVFDMNTNDLISPMSAAILGLGLNLAAYMAEIVRGGIVSVDEGQTEAALSIGMTRLRALRRVVLPQAIPVILPAAGNQLIALLKYTSLVSVIAVEDLLYSSQIVYQANFKVIPLLLVASIWYLIVTSVLSIGQYYLERHYARGTMRTLPLTPWQRVRESVGYRAITGQLFR